MKVRATATTIAVSIAIVNAETKSGEKVFNAYMMFTPFVLNCWLVGKLVGSARLFSLCSSVVNRNEWVLPHRVMAAL